MTSYESANPAAAVNAPIAPLFHSGHGWRRVTEQRRSAMPRAMAYMCIMASVPSDRVAEIRTPGDISRVASKLVFASHYIVPACPEIQEAIDGGIPLDTDTSHPLRGFMLHQPPAVQRHAVRLATVASDTSHPTISDDYIRTELSKVVDLFQHASVAGEAVITSLDLSRKGKKTK